MSQACNNERTISRWTMELFLARILRTHVVSFLLYSN